MARLGLAPWGPLAVLVACLGTSALADEPPKAESPTPTPPPRLDFNQDVRGFFRQYCFNCHNSGRRRGGIALDSYRDVQSMLKDRKVFETVQDVLLSGEMPPGDKPQPPEEEAQKIAAWIEDRLGQLDCKGVIEPGRVTMRRLNRFEYDNTIRDLLGVDLHPADDFPADDIGYGFDHIGDVLSMPPVLMEKYLGAAEAILDRAIQVPPARIETVRAFDPEHLKPITNESEGPRVLASVSEVFQNVPIRRPGRYRLVGRASGDQAGPEPTRMAFRVDGKEIKVVDVSNGRDEAKSLDAEIDLTPGDHRVALAFLNDYYKPDDPDPKLRGDRNLYVHGLEVLGPLPGSGPPPPATHQRIFALAPEGADDETKIRAILEKFATRAFRRPVEKDEVDRLVTLAVKAREAGEPFEGQVKLASEAVLVSPSFLFRVESIRSEDKPGSIGQVRPVELASRLSYFLWSSMPDDELLEAAVSGKLADDSVLDGQVRRMLMDPKAQRLVDNFAEQWLQIRGLKTHVPDPNGFPSFDEPLRQAILREPLLFFGAIVREDRSVLDLINADFTYVNERLAKHYGIPDVRGDEFRKVALRNDQRGGVVTMAAVLTVTSHPTRTSPVKRGKWILEQILGTPPPPPPPDIPPLNEDKDKVLSGTLRQRLEQHRSNPGCATCHNRLDPLGFGLENYDAIGAWRIKDGDFPVDTKGTLPDGVSFEGPAGLKGILKSKQDQFLRSFTEKLLTYALGRGLDYYDQCTVGTITANAARDGYTFSALVREIVRSDPFRKRQILGERRS